MGLFALRDFEEGEIVARYSGVRASYSTFMQAWESGLTSGDYLCESAIGDGDDELYVDGSAAECSALGRYVNHSVRRKNADLCSNEFASFGVEYVQADRRVAAGREFFIDYGREYWDAKLGSAQKGSPWTFYRSDSRSAGTGVPRRFVRFRFSSDALKREHSAEICGKNVHILCRMWQARVVCREVALRNVTRCVACGFDGK